jgi:copper chaperone
MSTTITVRVDGMHCASCGLLVDDAVEDLPGVHSSQTSTRDGRTVVRLDPAQCSPQDIVAAITALGYQASHVP